MSSARTEISFEFFPARSEDGLKALVRSATKLSAYRPEFYSVTYGAGGSTRHGTFKTVSTLRSKGFNAIPHLSWGEESRDEVCALVDKYLELGVSRLVLIRGDVPSGSGRLGTSHFATELVDLIRQKFGTRFTIYVAAYPEMHPQSLSPTEDIRRLKEKLSAGANACITQYFYSVDAYRRLVADAARCGIDHPIFAGVMPITNYERLVRFSDGCGAEIPRWIRGRLKELARREAELRDFGAEVVGDLCRQLLDDGAPGLHFYTLNQWRATARILERLALS